LTRYLDQETANLTEGTFSVLNALPKDTTSELAGLSSHYPSFMLNVKQGSCEYQLLKFFGLNRPGNRTQIYRPKITKLNFIV